MNIYKGISASDGICIGSVFLVESNTTEIIKIEIPLEEKESGWAKFEEARLKVMNYTELSSKSSSKDQNTIFQTYTLMLSDPEFISQVKKDYFISNYNIEYILNETVEEFAKKLRDSKDEYLMERAVDITDIYNKVIDEMLGKKSCSLSSIPENSIIVAKSLSPSDATILSQKKITGLITEAGGKNSHLAILARTFAIPFIFGIENVLSSFENNETVIIDGFTGYIYKNPDKETKQIYLNKSSESDLRKQQLSIFTSTSAKTKDGTNITLLANIGNPDETTLALSEGSDGIGLFRSEFLFLDNSDMSEERQFNAYKLTLEQMGNKPVTIRTIDAGGDKIIQGNEMPTGNEKNPLLGWRAIRFCLDKVSIFKTQLRALYRASIYGNLKIMIPMITSIDQINEVRKIISEVKQELDQEKVQYSSNIPIGVMIETPAAAIVADQLSSLCDFYSIGTNDLTQYTICIDRENSSVSSLFTEFHPAVLRLILFTIKSSENAKIALSVCGEMAGSIEGAFMLIGLGIRTLSVSPNRINILKEALSKVTLKELQTVANENLSLSDSQLIKDNLLSFIATRK